MAQNNNNNTSWAASPSGENEAGIQSQPMGLKVHYTFDKDSQERCLARWPHILQIQTVPVDERNSIGVVDLRTCLQAVAQCSPEIANNGELDYTVYAFDYSEPDTPLVGQGMLSRALNQGLDPLNAQPQLVTGRVTRNMLAIFGNGVRETLEVRLKLTAVHRPAQPIQAMHAQPQLEPRPSTGLNRSMSAMSETNEWNSFITSNPNLGRPPTGSATQSPALAPARPYIQSFEPRNDQMVPVPQMSQMAPSSRPSSAGPMSMDRRELVPIQAAPPNMSHGRSGLPDEAAPIQPIVKPIKPQSRPSSRASSRAPTGRPRGRPRKKPQTVEGHTSGYEDGTDADDGPPMKKRATTTKVERSNTATFGSAPDSLRVAASTSGSIRNFRPIALGGDAQNANHLQEIPRAPTPVPIPRLPNRHNQKSALTSSLRRGSTSGSTVDRPFTTSYLDVNRSATQNADGRSPDSAAATPFPIDSDGPSPAEIGSSPPVPRSAMYSMRSSPMPSSPILPPMPAPLPQIDSGFMSGGLDDNRMEDDEANKFPPPAASEQPVLAKPKPRRNRSKKQPSPKESENPEQNKPQAPEPLVIHTETPGPPELLPQTSLYNPPQPASSRAQAQRKGSQKPKTPAANDITSEPSTAKNMPAAMSPAEPQTAQSMTAAQTADSVAVMSPEEQASQNMSPEDVASQTWSPEPGMLSQADLLNLEKTLMSEFGDNAQNYLDSFNFSEDTFTPVAEESQPSANQLPFPVIEPAPPKKQPAPLQAKREKSVPEPELPMVPASDPVVGQLSLPMPASEPAHPRTDAPEPDVRANKNFVKRQAIKQKLEEAIAMGQMPTFCRNCGALQTPTWRKIWKKTHKGAPGYHDYSEKPGCVTAIEILQRNDNNEPTSYEMIKKALGPNDDKTEWTEISLCNPCGIWFSKWKKHRPAEKWEKDEQRLNQTRKKRVAGSAPSRSKKPRTKSDSQMGLTSEAGIPTDPLGPPEAPTSPKSQLQRSNSSKSDKSEQQGSTESEKGSGRNRKRAVAETKNISTHSRGSGRAESPVELDDELGPTRRLLFPSPRKEGETKSLGEVAVNIVQTAPDYRGDKNREGEAEKENQAVGEGQVTSDDFAELFGSTPARPSTPPSKSAESVPFKTPTRPPSHRPVTRSVTHSVLRSGRSLKSPNLTLMLDRTPTRSTSKTPRSAGRKSSQAGLHTLDSFVFDSPMTKSISQMLSEANGFDGVNSPNSRFQLDLGMLNSDEMHLNMDAHFDFSALLSTDGAMPSSPPMLGKSVSTTMVSFGGSLTYEDTNSNLWGHITGQGDGENSQADGAK